MTTYATRDFPLLGETVDEDTNLSTYPRGTLRWLTERGLASTSTTFVDGDDAEVDPNDYSQEGFRRLLKLGLAAPGTPVPSLSMAYFNSANWYVATGGSSPRTVTASWAAGDDVYVIGLSGDSARTLAVPTATGLTFAAVTNGVGATRAYVWKATAAAPGSSVVITSTCSGGPAGIAALVVTGSAGVGTIATPLEDASGVLSLARAHAGSGVLFVAADSSTDAATHSWTPSGYTERVGANNGVNFGTYIGTWLGQGAAATADYGQSGSPGGWLKLAVEIQT